MITLRSNKPYNVRIIKTKFHFNTGAERRNTVCVIRYQNPFDYNIHTAVGVARCSSKDTYDVITGLRIAESRAKINMYKQAGDACYAYCTEFNYKHAKLVRHEINHLLTLVK